MYIYRICYKILRFGSLVYNQAKQYIHKNLLKAVANVIIIDTVPYSRANLVAVTP